MSAGSTAEMWSPGIGRPGLRRVAGGQVRVQHHAVGIEAQQRVGQRLEDRRVARIGRMQVLHHLDAAEQVADAVAEQRPVHGLDDEIGGAGIVGAPDRFDVVHAGDHDDGELLAELAAQMGANLVAIQARHVHIEQDHVAGFGRKLAQGILAIFGKKHLEAGLFQAALISRRVTGSSSATRTRQGRSFMALPPACRAARQDALVFAAHRRTGYRRVIHARCLGQASSSRNRSASALGADARGTRLQAVRACRRASALRPAMACSICRRVSRSCRCRSARSGAPGQGRRKDRSPDTDRGPFCRSAPARYAGRGGPGGWRACAAAPEFLLVESSRTSVAVPEGIVAGRAGAEPRILPVIGLGGRFPHAAPENLPAARHPAACAAGRAGATPAPLARPRPGRSAPR
jgi:hypothetical protein